MSASASSAGAYHAIGNGNGNGHASHTNGNGLANGNGNGAAANGRVSDHSTGTTAVASVKAKRGVEPTPASINGTASRANGSASLYPGMASAEEYNAATASGSRTQKRKVEESAVVSKRRKKGCVSHLTSLIWCSTLTCAFSRSPDASPDVAARVLPSAAVAGIKPPRRAATKVEEPAAAAYDDEDMMDAGDAEDDGDGHTYCVCNQVSFGEMIGCDGSDCEREWVSFSSPFHRPSCLLQLCSHVSPVQFHLSCVGLQAIPKGRWFCDDCRVRRCRSHLVPPLRH